MFFVLVAPFALSAQHYTFRVFGGHNHISLKSLSNLKVRVSDGQVAGVAIGYRFTDLLKGEVEATYRYNRVKSQIIKGGENQFTVPLNGKFESIGVMGNMFFTWPIHHYLQPYVGFGAGGMSEHSDWVIALIDHNIWYDFEEGKRSGIAYQMIVGCHLPQQNGIYIGAEFRIVDSVLDHMTTFNRSLLFSVKKEF